MIAKLTNGLPQLRDRFTVPNQSCVDCNEKHIITNHTSRPRMASSLLTASSLFIGSTLLVLSGRSRHLRQTAISLFSSSSIPSPRRSLGQAQQIAYWESRDHENSHLEEVLGEKALNWVKEKNALCFSSFGNPEVTSTYPKVLSILESKEKIPSVEKIGNHLYNFWKDDQHARGVWRRTTMESYRTSAPVWEIVLDLDELGRQENQSWVYGGHSLLDLDPTAVPSRTLIHLSPGGSDATVIREFDLTTCRFVDPLTENGFVLPEAKSSVCWKSPDLLVIGTDFHDNQSLTLSGYPRVVHEWTRGTPLKSSPRVYEGDEKDLSASQVFFSHCGYVYEYRVRSLTFFTSTYSIRAVEGGSGEWQEISLPEDVSLEFFRNMMLITTRCEWTPPNHHRSYAAGSLISVGIDDFLANGLDSALTVLFEPTATVSLESMTLLQSFVILTVLDDIKSRLIFWEYSTAENQWICRGQEAKPVIRGVTLYAYDSDRSNMFWMNLSTFLTPSRLFLFDAEAGVSTIQSQLQTLPPLKSLPAYFDSSSLVESQFFATSSDGTLVPYFILHSKNMVFNGRNKTLLYGYGGFEVSVLPTYAAVAGATWLTTSKSSVESTSSEGCVPTDRVYVIANIRGGGEYGPKWHQAALKEKRVNAFNDFIAVAEDLIRRQITSPASLAIRGGSNGGLLMGNMITMRPDLFQSVICVVPLLDMKRYSHLLAGASWTAEYGDPDDPSDWSYLQNYSSYHNIDSVNAASRYPNLLMLTSTKDDRVHPYHARSFIARLDSVGCQKHWYYENIEGGHGGAADSKQQAFVTSLYTEFLLRTLE
jgi:prolyl oligopeptidase